MLKFLVQKMTAESAYFLPGSVYIHSSTRDQDEGMHYNCRGEGGGVPAICMTPDLSYEKSGVDRKDRYKYLVHGMGKLC